MSLKDPDKPRRGDVLAFKSRPDHTPPLGNHPALGGRGHSAAAPIDHERETSPDKPEDGSPDWLLGRLLVDHEHFKAEVKKDGDETRAILNDLSVALAETKAKLDGVLRLAPTEREKAAIKWLIGVVVTAILARFGIDAVNMP